MYYSNFCYPRYSSHNGKTPLLCAAEAGHDEIVAYLLEFREVQTYLKKQSDKVQSTSVSNLHDITLLNSILQYYSVLLGRA